MIKRLKYAEIDFDKYSACLNNSAQYKYSAEQKYLDVTSDKSWDLLVYKDYEAIMPVPYLKKLGIKLVINPMLCQQLGIFSPDDSPEINDLFLNYLEKKYNIWYYAFNETNRFTKGLKSRKNYVILSDSYETVRRKYSSKRRSTLNLNEEIVQQSSIAEIQDYKDAKSFIVRNLVGLIKLQDQTEYLRIFEKFHEGGALKFYGFLYKSKIVNLIAVYHSANSVTLLGSFNDKNHLKLAGSSILIDYAIKNNIESKIFDFEGSEIPNVEKFFRGFRPELKSYNIISYSKKEVCKRLFGF